MTGFDLILQELNDAGRVESPAIAALLIGTGNVLLPCLIYGLVSVPLGLILILPADRFG